MFRRANQQMNFIYNRFIHLHNHINDISFVLSRKDALTKTQNYKQKFQTLFLLDTPYQFEIYQHLPKSFTITTRNGSSQFNFEMLANASKTISEEYETNPTISEYHLDVSDEGNVLEKFSQLFQGKLVKFTEEDLPVSYKIIRTLQIARCPDFLKPYNLRTGLIKENKNAFQKKEETEKDVVINQSNFNCFISENSFKNFTIITNKKEYKCKLYAVYSSQVISDFLKRHQNADQYRYEFEDEYGEFDDICKVFNFEKVSITRDNMSTLNKIIDDLEITFLKEQMNKFNSNYDKMNEEFEYQQEEIDELSEIIDHLYHINSENVDKFANELKEKRRFEKSDSVRELTSYIIQVLKTDETRHESLLQLIENLSKSKGNNSTMKNIKSEIIQQVLFLLGINKSICSFAYKLYKLGYIQKDQLFDSIREYNEIDRYKYDPYFTPYQFYTQSKYIRECCNIIPIWFLPELIEIDEKSANLSENQKTIGFKPPEKPSIFTTYMYYLRFNDASYEYLASFLPDKLDLYKKIRDFGKPFDELTISLQNDDVDKFQSILSQRPIKKNENDFITYNIFDNFPKSGKISFIDYAAAHGSLKCFKYLLLNHHQITYLTFEYSIYGGNIEIIKIVDQQQTYEKDFFPSIIETIVKHQYDLFDWLFEQKFASNIDNSNINLLDELVECSVKNGNIHSFIEIIDKGYDLSPKFNEMMNFAASNGFYKIAKIITEIVHKKDQKLDFNTIVKESNSFVTKYIPCISFGNTSMLNLFIDSISFRDLQIIYNFAAVKEYMDIIKYIENLPEEKFKLTNDILLNALEETLNHKTDILFNHLISKYDKNAYKDCNPHREYQFESLLEKACKLKKNEYAKKIIELVIDLFPKKDFSTAFIFSVSLNLTDVVQFLIDHKVLIVYENILSHFDKISSADEKTFPLFINNVPPILKQLFINNNLNVVIKNENIYLIEYLLKQKVESSNSLIEAVKTNNIEVVNTVLKYIDPIFINNNSNEGPAICIASRKNNQTIIKRLLCYSEIDLSLFGPDNMSALNIAINNMNIEIINTFLEFYGDKIKNETTQLNESLKLILQLNSKPKLINENKSLTKNRFDIDDPLSQDDPKNKDSKPIKLLPIFKRIIEIENVDLNICSGDFTVLSFASKMNEKEIVEFLLNTNKVDVNLTGPNNGNTALMNSIINNNYDITKVLLEYRTIDINQRNYENKSALILSVESNNIEIIKLLIEHPTFNSTQSFLNYAFYISTPEISKQLISIKNLDVNYINKKSKSDFLFSTKLLDMINCSDVNDKFSNEIIDLIIQHPSFDKEKSLAKYALFKSTHKNVSIEIFKKLLTLFNNDINIINEDGNSLLTTATNNRNENLITYILNYPNFDCNKSEILYAFVLSESCPQIRNDLHNYIKDHSQIVDFNRILPNGNDPPRII